MTNSAQAVLRLKKGKTINWPSTSSQLTVFISRDSKIEASLKLCQQALPDEISDPSPYKQHASLARDELNKR